MATDIDYNLLKFETYEDYLLSFIKIEDYRYLGGMRAIRRFVKLGYRTNAKVYEEHEYTKLRNQLLEYLNPKFNSAIFFGSYLKVNDAALVALADREELNMMNKLATIIFLQVRQRSGFDLSGYIDYAKSLRDCIYKTPDHTNWRGVFEGRVALRPKPSDLSYYDWHKGIVSHNNTESFEALRSDDGLIFKHKGDHKLIPVTTKPSIHEKNVQRTMIPSDIYGFIILYDHVVR
ncbi:cilia- and flagella-associated protein 299-like [Drosophila busckii]|uniref:cilia- and flagella-associated protein 299-like n=1 Tax=Drosophila busckii TaxID=30019 RepID=UPI001432DCC2|nr:cilia- and flagella-associated protein 299-like [Drosophila busckii]